MPSSAERTTLADRIDAAIDSKSWLAKSYPETIHDLKHELKVLVETHLKAERAGKMEKVVEDRINELEAQRVGWIVKTYHKTEADFTPDKQEASRQVGLIDARTGELRRLLKALAPTGAEQDSK